MPRQIRVECSGCTIILVEQWRPDHIASLSRIVSETRRNRALSARTTALPRVPGRSRRLGAIVP